VHDDRPRHEPGELGPEEGRNNARQAEEQGDPGFHEALAIVGVARDEAGIAFAGLNMREAVGKSLLVIAINSAAGFLGHLGGGQLDAGLIAVLTAAAVGGALVGERFARDVSTLRLRRSFGVIVVAVGVAIALAGGLGGHAA
jgi:hypothetical protein